MNPDNLERPRLNFRTCFVALLFITLGISALKFIQVILFHNASSGLIARTLSSNILFWIMTAGVMALLFCSFRSALPSRAASETPGNFSPLSGVALFFAGCCFATEGLIDISRGFLYVDRKPDKLALILLLFCFLSAAAMFLNSFRILWQGKEPDADFCVFPLIWNLLVIIHLLLSYPDILSMQSSSVKTVAALCSLCVLLDMERQFSHSPSAHPSIQGALYAAAPALILFTSLPYITAWVFQVRNKYENMPYLAFVGVAVYAFCRLLDLVRKTDLKKADGT